MEKRQKTICFAASSGGHFEQLMMLKPLMEKYNGFIVTESTQYNKNNTDDNEKIKTYYLKQVNRKEILMLFNMLINFFKSLKILIINKPDIIITTGVLAIIPLCLMGKIFGKKIIFIESFAKIESPTLTGKMMYKFADQFYVQWPNMLKIYPKAIYKGGIY